MPLSLPVLFFSSIPPIVGCLLLQALATGTIGEIGSTAPSTIVPVSIGLALDARGAGEAGSLAVATALSSVPMGEVIGGLSVGVFAAGPRVRRVMGPATSRLAVTAVLLGGTIIVWLASSAAWLWFAETVDLSVPVRLGIGLVLLLVVGSTLTAVGDAGDTPTPPRGGARCRSPTRRLLLLTTGRATVAAAIVVGAVALARSFPAAGGFAAVFPVIFLTVLVAADGDAAAARAVGPLVLGAQAVSTYATVFPLFLRLLSPSPSLPTTVSLSYASSLLLGSLPSFFLVRKLRQRKSTLFTQVETSLLEGERERESESERERESESESEVDVFYR
jgi:hypothetical protein